MVQGKETTIRVTSNTRKQIPSGQYIIVSNTHDPIINEALFNDVQYRLSKRRKIITNTYTHLFSNLLICSDYGKGLHYKVNSKGYACGTYDRRGNEACSSHQVREAKLEAIIIQKLNHFIKHCTDTSGMKTLESSLLSSAQNLNSHIATC